MNLRELLISLVLHRNFEPNLGGVRKIHPAPHSSARFNLTCEHWRTLLQCLLQRKCLCMREYNNNKIDVKIITASNSHLRDGREHQIDKTACMCLVRQFLMSFFFVFLWIIYILWHLYCSVFFSFKRMCNHWICTRGLFTYFVRSTTSTAAAAAAAVISSICNLS